ncbi:glycosyltransferase [Nostoc sp. MS1]|uniref:glycosyltransferase n=1 Tax=Nostoc sp. MS1 TaxID=2764711 RepID=UPI001CC58C09|nr:glycosyltransferase [Nostoc sp. MS1]BCL35199.1 hypothetical protein NSMS1_16460 [Nostoc sp. MS1]
MINSHIPRLIYIGDVPVESTVAGSALLYRLLQEYPGNILCIVEGNIAKSQKPNRLKNVIYKTIFVGYNRALNSRFTYVYTSYLLLTAKWRSHQLDNLIKSFQPEAILTVAHGLSWITAAELAKKHDLPLHLIIHDEWTSFIPVLPQLKNLVKQIFGSIYKQAKSRLCVSPYMMKYYEQQYGVKGSVLYPLRARDVSIFEQPPDKLSQVYSSLVFAYAGSVHTRAYANSLISLASVLELTGDRLLIYSSLTPESIERIGLNKPNIIVHSLIPSQRLIHKLREDADILFVPMSFEQEDRPNMEMSFPSKLTDYTVIGLPLLIWGPHYCSAVRWAKENPGVAEVVENQDIGTLTNSVKKLSESSEYRFNLAVNALVKGVDYFSYTKVVQSFYQAIN